MTKEWPTLSVDEIKAPVPGALAMGPFGSNITTDNFVPQGVPVIRGLNLNGERFKDEKFVFLTDDKADELHSANAFPDDLVFTHRGTLGQVGIIPKNARYPRYVVSQSQMKLSCDNTKVDPLFVFYYFRSNRGQHALLANTSTTGVPAISRPLTSLKAIRIPFPPLAEQCAIAHILGTLDDKIELNRRMNETLEAMARAIFKSWFVDFDPVRAKAEGRQPDGLDADTAAFFPDSFEDSPVGKIPKGWRVRSLGEIAEIIMGQSPPGETYNEVGEGLPFYQGIRDFGWRFPSRRVYCTQPTRFAEMGDVLLSVRAPVGSLNIALESCAIGRGLAALRLKPSPGSFLLYLLKSDDAIWEKFEAKGTVFGAATKGDIHSIEVIQPSHSQIIQAFNKIVGSFDARMEAIDNESHILADIRDALLPKLLSGEVRIGNAEKWLEAPR